MKHDSDYRLEGKRVEEKETVRYEVVFINTVTYMRKVAMKTVAILEI